MAVFRHLDLLYTTSRVPNLPLRPSHLPSPISPFSVPPSPSPFPCPPFPCPPFPCLLPHPRPPTTRGVPQVPRAVRNQFGTTHFTLPSDAGSESDANDIERDARASSILTIRVAAFGHLLDHARFLRFVRRQTYRVMRLIKKLVFAAQANQGRPAEQAIADRAGARLRGALEQWATLFPWHTSFVFEDVDFFQVYRIECVSQAGGQHASG